MLDKAQLPFRMPIGSFDFLSRSILTISLALLGLLTLAVFSLRVVQPGPLDYIETWHGYCAQQVGPGGNHVGSIAEFPHNSLPYAPPSYYLNHLAGKIAGGSLAQTITMGRLFCLLGLVGSAFVMIRIAIGLGSSALLAVVGATIFLSNTPVQVLTLNLRPDAMASMLSLIGIYLTLFSRRAMLAGAFLGLAFCWRFSYISAPALIFLWWISQGEWKQLVKMVGGFIAVAVIVAATAPWLLGDHWAEGMGLQNLENANYRQALGYIQDTLKHIGNLPILIAVGLLFWHPLPPRVRFLCCYCTLAFTLNSIAMAKSGAYLNYMIEPLAIGCIVFSWTLTQASQLLKQKTLTPVWTALTLLVIALGIGQGIAASQLVKYRQRVAESHGFPISAEAIAKGQLLLSNDCYLYFKTGNIPVCCPPDMVKMAIAAGKVKEQTIRDIPLERGYDVVAFDFTPGNEADNLTVQWWLPAVLSEYSPDGESGEHTIYRRSNPSFPEN